MTEVTTSISSIKYSSIASTGNQFRQLNLEPTLLGDSVTEAMKLSPTKGLRLTKAILTSAESIEQSEKEGRQLITWASENGPEERQLIVRSLFQIERPIFLVHGMSELTRPKARAFMVDYFNAGGDMKTIVQWLKVVGGVLRKHRRKSSDTTGFIVDAVNWIVDTAEDAVDAISEGIESIVDAVVNAGRDLVDFISEVALS